MRPDESRVQSSTAVAIDDAEQAANAAAHRDRIAGLYLEHQRSLLRMLTARGCTVDQAREIAQEAYVQLLQLGRPDAVSFLEAYLFRTAINISIDRGRRAQYRRGRGVVLAGEVPAQHPSPEENSVAGDRIRVVEQALKELPVPWQEAFRLRILEELPLQEVADRIGIDISTVKRHVARALAHCKLAVGSAEQHRERGQA